MARKKSNNLITTLNRSIANDLPGIKVYFFGDDSYIKELQEIKKKTKCYSKKKIQYYNVSCGFDIETTSTYKNGTKYAFLYEWTFGIDNIIIIGRTIEEFKKLYLQLIEIFSLTTERRLLCYIHNLSFEFQFIKGYFEFEKVFAIKERTPIYAITYGLEFRCSYLLSGYSLAKLAENLKTHKIKKLKGELDYTKIRTPITPLTVNEYRYCVYDVVIILYYIAEKIETDGKITKILLTKTGYAREYTRNETLKRDKSAPWLYYQYYNYIHNMELTIDDYEQLKRAFQGGFTHANAIHSKKTLFNIASYDFTSSYPAIMVLSNSFPVSSFRKSKIKDKNDFNRQLLTYACLFDITIYNIKKRIDVPDSILSKSKCFKVVNPITDNGRIMSADMVSTTVTNIDFQCLKRFYTWDNIEIFNFKIADKGYLPKSYILAVLKLYADKTTLKGVDGKEFEYQNSKELLNALYGMCVTDICKDELTYDNIEGWEKVEKEKEPELNKYNANPRRFIFYAWGVFITALARLNLYTALIEFGNDYIYSDTDSVKVKNYEKHKKYIDDYNNKIIKKIEAVSTYYNIDEKLFKPKTIKGIEKIIGVWDFEGVYQVFKTLGAKRYITMKDNELSFTVSGCSKFSAIPYLIKTYGKYGAFKAFDDDLYIPNSATGKMTHTYIDEPFEEDFTDYNGIVYHIKQKSCIHLEPCDFTLSLSIEYIKLLFAIEEEME